MTFLVDYENVPNTGLEGIEQLTEKDRVVIFLNENNTFKARTHVKLENALAEKDYIFVNVTGPNALDFQLVTYLGMLCMEKPEEQYVVVSKDQGFDAAIKFLKGRQRNVSRKTDLAMNNTLADVKKLIPEFSDKEQNSIVNIIETYKTKQAINNNIMKQFGSGKTGTIYKKIKILLKDKS